MVAPTQNPPPTAPAAQDPAMQAPAPPQKKVFVIRGGKVVGEDPSKLGDFQQIAQKLGLPFEQMRGLAAISNPHEGDDFFIKGKNGETISLRRNADPQAAQPISMAVRQLLFQQAPQPQNPPPPAQQQTPAPSPQQQQTPAPAQQTAPPSATDQQLALLKERLDLMQNLMHQPQQFPAYIPQAQPTPAAANIAAPIPVPNQPRVHALLLQDLRGQLPHLQQIHREMPPGTLDHAQLNLQIVQLGAAGAATPTQTLMDSSTILENIVHRYLQAQIPILRGHNLPVPANIGATQLNELLDLHHEIKQGLIDYYRQEIGQIGTVIPMPAGIDAIHAELGNDPTLQRLIDINTAMTDHFHQALVTKRDELINSTQDMQAAFAMPPIAPRQTRAALIALAPQIEAQFGAYIATQRGLLPAGAQIITAPPSNPAQMPTFLLDHFRDYLAIQPNDLKQTVSHMPETTFADLAAKHQQMETNLRGELQGKVRAAIAFPNPTPKRVQQLNEMLGLLGFLTLQALDAHLATNPNLERLKEIKTIFDQFLFKQRNWVVRHPYASAVGAIAVIALAAYFYYYLVIGSSKLPLPVKEITTALSEQARTYLGKPKTVTIPAEKIRDLMPR